MHVHEMAYPRKPKPMRYTLLRCMPKRDVPKRGTLMRDMPMRDTPETHL